METRSADRLAAVWEQTRSRAWAARGSRTPPVRRGWQRGGGDRAPCGWAGGNPLGTLRPRPMRALVLPLRRSSQSAAVPPAPSHREAHLHRARAARAAVDPTAAASRGRRGCRRVSGGGAPADHTPAVGAAAAAVAAAPSGRARAARGAATVAAARRVAEPPCGVGRCGRAHRRGSRRRQRWPTAADAAATCATAVDAWRVGAGAGMSGGRLRAVSGPRRLRAASASALPTLPSACTVVAGRSPARRAAMAAAAVSTVGAPGGNKRVAGAVGVGPPAPSRG